MSPRCADLVEASRRRFAVLLCFDGEEGGGKIKVEDQRFSTSIQQGHRY